MIAALLCLSTAVVAESHVVFTASEEYQTMDGIRHEWVDAVNAEPGATVIQQGDLEVPAMDWTEASRAHLREEQASRHETGAVVVMTLLVVSIFIGFSAAIAYSLEY